MIALTGSVESGRSVARAAVDIAEARAPGAGGQGAGRPLRRRRPARPPKSLRAAGYWNSGQECGAGCRVLVHESVADDFIARLVDRGQSTLVVGEPVGGRGRRDRPASSPGPTTSASSAIWTARPAGGDPRGPRRRRPGRPGVLRRPHRPRRRPRGRRVRPRGDLRPGRDRRDVRVTEEEAVRRANRHRLRPGRLGLDRRTRAAATTSRRASTSGRSGSTPTSSCPTSCPGAGSRAPATGGTSRSTRSTTTRAPSTSCTTTAAEATSDHRHHRRNEMMIVSDRMRLFAFDFMAPTHLSAGLWRHGGRPRAPLPGSELLDRVRAAAGGGLPRRRLLRRPCRLPRRLRGRGRSARSPTPPRSP